MPSTTTDVEFLDNNDNIINGHIEVDMAGFYAVIRKDICYAYSSFDYYKAWRFKTDK